MQHPPPRHPAGPGVRTPGASSGGNVGEGTGPTDLSPEEAWRRIEAGARLIDVRDAAEHAAGAVPGAVWVARDRLVSKVPAEVGERGDEIVLYCAVGHRSRLAVETLTELGYRRVSSVAGGIAAWRRAGLPWAGDDAGLTVEQRYRYGRHLTLAQVGEAGQRRLLDATVTLIGAGGLGSPAALYLAAAGVGRLVVVDDDEVELGNLHRQVLHRTDRIGALKVDSARHTLTNLNPDVAVETRAERLDAGNVLSLIADADVVIDGADNFPTRYLLNDASLHTGVPVVHGSVLRFEGQVAVFDPYRGPCYRCLYPLPPPPELAPSCAEVGVLGVLPGVIGTIQATEALKILLGIGEPLTGWLLTYDALEQSFVRFAVDRDPDCPACADEGRPPAIVDYDRSCRPGGPTVR